MLVDLARHREASSFRSKADSKEDTIPTQCAHLDQVREVTPSGAGCQQCIDMGDTWVHLRLCLTCGQVGCCESSKNTHALKHSHGTGHPIVESFEPGESWRWCYPDSVFVG